jgi:hypothetical protein
MLMNYLEVANGTLMLGLCSLAIVFIMFQSLIFIRTAWKRGIEVGIDKGVMKKAMTNAAVFSVVPSLPIIVMLALLTVNLGKYFPWLRLSVVGSAVYENMAADIVAKSSGLSGIADTGFDLRVFATAMWVMSVGIIWGIVFNIFFMKSLDKFSKNAKASNNRFIPIFSSALFIGMLSLMSAPYLTDFEKNRAAIVAFISSSVAVILCGRVSKAVNIKSIDDFSLPIGMIVGMAAAVAYTNIIV